MQGKNNGEEENRVRKTGDSSCSLPSHFWSTSQSPFSTGYIPFQSSGSQESNASNCVRFGAKMRKIRPSEDNCIKQVRISHHQPKQVRISHHQPCKCEFRTMYCSCDFGVKFPLFYRLHMRSFLLCFLMYIPFLSL